MKRHFNYQLFLLVSFLLLFGLLFLAALSAPVSLEKFGTPNYFFYHQLLYGLLPAILIGFVTYKLPLDFIKKWAPLALFANLAVMAIVFLPFFGAKFYGAQRWLKIGGAVFQPSEALKLTAILYISAWIASKLSEENVKGWKSSAQKGYHNLIYVLLPFAVFLGVISVIMILQPDISTLGIIALTLLVVYFSAKTPLWHTATIVLLGMASLAVLIKLEPYRLDRLLVFFNPEADPLGKGFQLKQSLIALGSGGFFGRGLGMSVEKFGYLPMAMSDSIFAVLGEETGIVGCTVVVALFILFFWMGMNIAKGTNNRFAKLAAVGISFWIILQAFINIGSAIGVFPLSGIPLPFFSYGGSHLLMELIGVGLLLNISKNA